MWNCGCYTIAIFYVQEMALDTSVDRENRDQKSQKSSDCVNEKKLSKCKLLITHYFFNTHVLF